MFSFKIFIFFCLGQDLIWDSRLRAEDLSGNFSV